LSRGRHRLRSRFEVFLEIASHGRAEVEASAIALGDAVRPVRVGHHVKLLALHDELVDQQLGTLVVDVVVASAVDEQEIALEAGGVGDR